MRWWLPWTRANDGLTWWQRRAYANEWKRGAGRQPSAAELEAMRAYLERKTNG